MALAVIASSFVNLVTSVVDQRETGVLKRRRATPVPAWALIGGRALAAATVSVGTTAVLVVVARAAFDVGLPDGAIPWLVLTVLAGAAAFCSLWGDLAVLAACAAAGLLVALRRFRCSPAAAE